MARVPKLRLLKTTDEFMVGGVSYPGFPLLIDQCGDALQPATEFLIHECLHRGAADSTNTWEVRGYALLDFFRFLNASKSRRRWDDEWLRGTPSILAAYRDWARTTQGQEKDTINLRLAVLTRFYRWTLHHGLIKALPFDMEERKVRSSAGLMAHVLPNPRTRSVADVRYRKQRRLVKVLTLGQVKTFLGALPNRVHNLMARLQLHTGLRVSELASFPTQYVVDPRAYPEVRNMFMVQLLPGAMNLKGGVERTIHVPRALMGELWAHGALDRRSRLSGRRQAALFVTEEGSPYRTSSIWRIYQSASNGLGFKVFPHILRHTFATHTLAALARTRNVGKP